MQKLAIILCLISLELTRAEHDPHLTDFFTNARSTHPHSQGHLCLRNCTNEKGFNSTEIISVRQTLGANRNPTDIFINILDQEIIGNICKAYNRTTECWSRCPDSEDNELQNVILPILSSVQFMCENPLFYDAIPCYKRVYTEMNETCNNEQNCGPKRNAVFATPGNNTLLCEYFICANKCRERNIVQSCGEEERTILYTVHRKILDSFERINRKFNQGEEEEKFFPPICDQIGRIV